MPFIYPSPRTLEKQALVGGGNCFDLIKELVPGLKKLPTSTWRRGAHVVDAKSHIVSGTAIATFDERGRNPNHAHGNHAAIFVANAGASIWVMDEWKNDPRRPWISLRLIYPGRRWRDGTFVDPSNSADAFYVIELH
jgi:hypothetical protein